LKTFLLRVFGGVKGLAFIAAVVAGLALHLYTQRVIQGLRAESRSLVQFYARMYARVAETESSEDIGFIFDEIIQRTTFPLIQTDDAKNPVGWKGIDVHPDDKSEAGMKKVRGMVRHMDGEIEPVAIRYRGRVLGYLFYGDSRLIRQLRWLPYVEVGIVGLFILFGFFGYANIKQNEQRHIWVGMAKETAHQLGTPISALLGWVELLKSGRDAAGGVDVYSEMEKDMRRLGQVSQRFGQIGSKPDLNSAALAPVLRDTAEYVRRRVPRVGRTVEIVETYAYDPKAPLNAGLFQWAVENVMKNALDAMDKPDGRIELRLFSSEKKRPVIEIEDNGRGMDNRARKRAFKPGYSTKKRGWGLGLTLAKRIVEEYHGGRMFVKQSAPGKGTVVRMEL
jgi:two-component system, NtrC family, sensor histidine kinase KinB